jgi:hypothetical protein
MGKCRRKVKCGGEGRFFIFLITYFYPVYTVLNINTTDLTSSTQRALKKFSGQCGDIRGEGGRHLRSGAGVLIETDSDPGDVGAGAGDSGGSIV